MSGNDWAFEHDVTASPEHIDELGHVNNAVWVSWIQDIAVAHWNAIAPEEHREKYIWVVSRHEIDYRGNIREGEIAHGRTRGRAARRALRPRGAVRR